MFWVGRDSRLKTWGGGGVGRIWAWDGRTELAQYTTQYEQHLWIPVFVGQGAWKGEAWTGWVWTWDGRSGEIGWVGQRNISLEDSPIFFLSGSSAPSPNSGRCGSYLGLLESPGFLFTWSNPTQAPRADCGASPTSPHGRQSLIPQHSPQRASEPEAQFCKGFLWLSCLTH